jgi:hypothetical protein
LAAVRRRSLEATRTPDLGLRGLHKIRLATNGHGWLVGDGGLVLTTADLGKTWTAPTGDLAANDDFDWHAMDMRGDKCWIAGHPGSRVLHTGDGGRTWQTFSTGWSLPIDDLCFVDDTHGWAVGAMGVVLHTADGGRTWQRQRSGGSRAAILALLAESKKAPLELFARLSGNEGYLSAVEFLNRRDLESPSATSDTLDVRAAEALSLVGASSIATAWNFPLRQPGLSVSVQQILDGWNRANDGQAPEHLESHLVRQIRTWRPDVIVTHSPSPRGNDPLGHLINQLVLRATEHAADATRFPEQTAQGLEPWRVKKVIGVLADGQSGQLNLTTSQLAPRLGCSLSELADRARALVDDEYSVAASTIGFQLAIDALPQGSGSHDFMSGLTLQPGGDARRKLVDVPEQGAELMRRVAQKHRNVQAILARSEHGSSERRAMTAQVGDLTMGLDESSSGDVLFQMAHYYWHAGRWDAAAEMFQLLAGRYPNHRLAGPSLVWLVQYGSSGEVAWQIERASRDSAASAELPTAGLMPTPARSALAAQQAAAKMLHPNRSVGLVSDALSETARCERANGIVRQMESQCPALFAEPSLQFAWIAAQRKMGLPGTGDRLFASITRTRSHDAWWTCAAGEQWLAEPSKTTPPKSIWRAYATADRPYLDGKLNDAIWKTAAAAELHSAMGDDGEWPAEVMAAYDAEFLYLAIRCRKAEGCDYKAAGGPRPRDPDLARRDRVELFIDIDRDYATFYRMAVDHRGWASEECWGDKTWDPSWFVAAESDATTWTAEAAIPLSALVRSPPQLRDVWTVGVQRIVPDVGFQSWTTPATATVTPEGFGYLVFE